MSLWYDKKAYALLKKCSDNQDMTEWNDYREETNHASVNLRYANLEDFYLIGSDLKYVDLRGANLNQAKCDSADVSYANISKSFNWKIFLLHMIFSLVGTLLLIYTLKVDPQIMKNFVEIIGENVIVGELIGIVSSILFTIIVLVIFEKLFNIFDKKDMPSYIILTISILNSIIGTYIVYEFAIISGSAFGIGAGINTLSFIMFLLVSGIVYDEMQKSISHAKNPKKSIGFDIKYLKDLNISLSARSDKEITIVKELIEKEKDEKEKIELQKKLKELQIEKEYAFEKEEKANTQQIKIQNALKHILRPYEYIEKNIRKLRRHNYFFYGVIGILLSVFIYALFENYLNTRSSQFSVILAKDSVSFGAIFGVILFYATPILFGMSIIIYAINQINKNIQSMESMQEQRRSIEVLQSTLLAQTEIADVSDNEIKALTQALQKGALERMFGQEKVRQDEAKETSSYREKLLVNNLSKFLTQALKK